MTNIKRSPFAPLLITFFLTAVVIVLTTNVKADEPCKSHEALAHLANIKKNQQGLKETRSNHSLLVNATKLGEKVNVDDSAKIVAAYNDFLDFKQWNESESAALHDLGCKVEWSDMTLVPVEKEQPIVTKAEVSDYSQKEANQVWIWKDAPNYKNERLAAYQGMLKARGITDPEQLKLLTAQIIQEAGSLSETTLGDPVYKCVEREDPKDPDSRCVRKAIDYYCSFGILQYNACAHERISAKAFLERHPEWKTFEYQAEQMANMVQERMKLYDGNMKQVIVHHNMPVAAKRGTDTPAGYYRSISSKKSLLISL